MSINLQIRPRRTGIVLKRRRLIIGLALIALLLAAGVYLRRTWGVGEALAALNQDVLSTLPVPVRVNIPQLQQSKSEPSATTTTEEDSVVMINEVVINHPQSEAYTADLHSFAGSDEIPWPHVGDRATIETYVVQQGDSLWGIAEQFELDIDTLRWSNPDLERNPDILTVGAELLILPVQGVYHAVRAGDTIDTIAAAYGVAPQDISAYPPNALFPPYDLEAGQGIIVPFGRKEGLELPKPALAPSSDLAWPLVGVITQGYKPDHLALDIGAPYGSTVYAAEAGTVTYAEWAQTGYGYTVIVDHGDGRETWYNHLKGALLSAGSSVSRGTPLGEVGSTGHSSGPHLHFEVRLNGQRINPTEYLPGPKPQ